IAPLSPRRRRAAERVVRRPRLAERLLTRFMGYTAAESHEHAASLGEVMTDDMVERISARLGDPERCPHGWPVDTKVEQAENRELVPLSELAPPSHATIVRLAEHDGSLLRWFYEQGLVPGARVELERVEEAADQITVRVDGEGRALS